MDCLNYFLRLWNERVNAPPAGDLVSMMAPQRRDPEHDPDEYLGNIIC